MKSEWRITCNYLCGEKLLYGVYRLRDVNKVDHSGNRENAGGYITDRAEAERLAAELNAKEKEAAE